MLSIITFFHLVTIQLHLPPGLLKSLCYVESGHSVNAINFNDGNGHSLGVCQIKLATAKGLGFKGTEKELMFPANNIFYAGKFLKQQISRYQSVTKGIVAYNLGHYKPTYTVYLKKVMKAYEERR